MALSKRAFCLLLLIIVCALGGGIYLIIWVMNKQNNSNENKTKISNEDRNMTSSASGLKDECSVWAQNPIKPRNFVGDFRHSSIAVRETILARTGEKIKRNAYWLTADPAKDSESLKGIRLQACKGKIPVVVIKMRPTEGIQLNNLITNWEYYKPSSPHTTWSEYDKTLNKYLRELEAIPTLLVLEPDLLMFTGDIKNHQYRWKNALYEDEFLNRAQRVIKRLSKSWIYLDAGNAAYLSQDLDTVDQMATSLLRLRGLRGFSINTMHFVNRTYNEKYARRLSCRTGLHYIVDTSRNGGKFSMQALHKIKQCLFDPPNMKKGQDPGWSWGRNSKTRSPRSKRWVHQTTSSNAQSSSSSSSSGGNRNQHQNNVQVPTINKNCDVECYNTLINDRRNNNDNNNKNNNNNHKSQHNNPSNYQTTTQANHAAESGTDQTLIRSTQEATEYLRGFKATLGRCMSQKSFTKTHDANVWIKAPGESDGRLYKYGTYHSCLFNHDVICDDECQMLMQENARASNCQCGTSREEQSKDYFPFGNFPFGDDDNG